MGDEPLERVLGKLMGEVSAIRSELERHAEQAIRYQDEHTRETKEIRAEIALIRNDITRIEVGHGRIGVMGHTLNAIVAAIFGAISGHTPMPGGH